MGLLDVRNVTKKFGNLLAVSNVSLNVPKGELRAVIGPNGAGKTTFFNLISGFFPPTSGSIIFDSRDITALSTHRRVALGMARTFQVTEIFAKSDRLVGELSHGDQRAAEIAMALALRPRLLLLDEPTAGMGDQETYGITQLIRRLHREANFTIVLIEHDMRVVFHLADRISVLDQGKLLAEGTPGEIAANETVQAAYLGKVT